MATEKKCVKFERSSAEQLKFFINFCRQHPEFQAGKNNPKEPRRMQLLWEEVAQGLNSLNGPTRTGMKWKETLGNWKNQLRTRARRIKMDQRLTGGGPSASRPLSDFEELALDTFGTAAVGGLERVRALGVAVASNGDSLPLSPGFFETPIPSVSLPLSPGVADVISPLPPSAEITDIINASALLPPSPEITVVIGSSASLPPSPGITDVIGTSTSLPPSPGIVGAISPSASLLLTHGIGETTTDILPSHPCSSVVQLQSPPSISTREKPIKPEEMFSMLLQSMKTRDQKMQEVENARAEREQQMVTVLQGLTQCVTELVKEIHKK